MFRKMISIILVLCVVVAYSIPTFASKDLVKENTLFEALDADSLSKEVEIIENIMDESDIDGVEAEQIVDDLENFESIGIDIHSVSLSEESEMNDIVYDLKLEKGITDKIEIKEDSYGNLSTHFTENGIENTVKFMNDGSLYLDGNKVEITFDEGLEDQTNLLKNKAQF